MWESRSEYSLFTIIVSDQEVAMRGNLPFNIVTRLLRLSFWDKATVGDALKFCVGYNFNPFNYLDRDRILA
tara:strand:+ start:91 stop:303 length:213 start_codon:yes stop_codon:yes gene_type:complete